MEFYSIKEKISKDTTVKTEVSVEGELINIKSEITTETENSQIKSNLYSVIVKDHIPHLITFLRNNGYPIEEC